MKTSLFQSILIGVFGVGALVGLFVFATYTRNNSGDNTIGSVIIWGTLPESDMKPMLTTMMQTNTELKSVSYVQKDRSSLSADLATAIATGDAPDLVLASQEELRSIARFVSANHERAG